MKCSRWGANCSTVKKNNDKAVVRLLCNWQRRRRRRQGLTQSLQTNKNIRYLSNATTSKLRSNLNVSKVLRAFVNESETSVINGNWWKAVKFHMRLIFFAIRNQFEVVCVCFLTLINANHWSSFINLAWKCEWSARKVMRFSKFCCFCWNIFSTLSSFHKQRTASNVIVENETKQSRASGKQFLELLKQNLPNGVDPLDSFVLCFDIKHSLDDSGEL